jgi:putative methyltransferase (TIGR04325 family)
MKIPIWEGIYKAFTDVPQIGKGFSGEHWVRNSQKKADDLRRKANGEIMPPATGFRESILPVIAAMLHSEMGRVRILDFGGGMGFTYYAVSRSLPDKEGVEFHIVEVEEVCRAGQDFYAGEPGILFHPQLPDGPFDIVSMGSSLHYIEDWRGILKSLCDYHSPYLLLSDLPAGDIPTYVSAQNYYGSKIPVWFFNVSEVIATVTDLNYRLIFKSAYVSNILGQEQPYPQDNFDLKYRIVYPKILLFRRKETT